MCSCVPFQIKRIIESFTTESAQISLYIRMTLEVTIQKSRQCEPFATYLAFEGIFGMNATLHYLCDSRLSIVYDYRVLNSMSPIDELDRADSIVWQSFSEYIYNNLCVLRCVSY